MNYQLSFLHARSFIRRISRQISDEPQKSIPHIFRNKYLKNSSAGGGTTYIGGTSSSITHTHENKEVLDSITAIDVDSWKNKLDKIIWDKAFIIDESNNLRVKLNLIGEGEVSAYGSGSTSGGGGVVTIVDNLTSSAVDCALSANQGRVLKNLIDNKSSVSSWNDLTDKPTTFTPSTHTHPISGITNLQSTLDSKASSSHTHNYASTVKIGTTAYNVASNVISLPAYPTVYTAADCTTYTTDNGALTPAAVKKRLGCLVLLLYQQVMSMLGLRLQPNLHIHLVKLEVNLPHFLVMA